MAVMDRGPVVIRRRLGSALKHLRLARGLQLEHVAKELEMSPAKLSRLETGQVAPKVRDVRDLLEEYDADPEQRQQMMRWADDAKEPGWWQPLSASPAGDLNLYISLEAEAAELRTYTICVPGLLQTRAYASMVIGGMAPQGTSGQHEELVAIRLRRQAVLEDVRQPVGPLRLSVMMDEAALYRGPNDHGIMAEQMTKLLQRSELPNVEIRVLPFSAGYCEAISMFSIFHSRQAGEAPVICVESTGHDAYFDGSRELVRYRSIWNDLASQAAGPSESVEIIGRALDRWNATGRS